MSVMKVTTLGEFRLRQSYHLSKFQELLLATVSI